MTISLDALQSGGAISSLDRHFASRMLRLTGEDEPLVALAAALVSRQVAAGHVCLDLHRIVRPAIWAGVDASGTPPDAGAWLEELGRSPLVSQPSDAEEGATPLVLDGAGRLFLRRYWDYQERLAHTLRRRADRESLPLDEALLRDGLARLFPAASDAGAPGPDRQRLAAAVAMLRPLAVITGGPGTGKTSTVVKILALAIEQATAANAPLPRIQLVAPTGKAAATLAESIGDSRSGLDCAEAIREAIPAQAATLHRLLGVLPGSRPAFRHHAGHQVPVDLLVVDEASMVDLALMVRLFDALPDAARVILLGDEHQLASVEAGAVLGEICSVGGAEGFSSELAARLEVVTGEPVAALSDTASPSSTAQAGAGSASIRDSIVRLTRSHRYGDESGIGVLARAVNEGDVERVLAVLASADHPDVVRHDPAAPGSLRPGLRDEIRAGFERFLVATQPAARLAAFDGFRLLCAHRSGAWGAPELNRLVESVLRREGLIEGERDAYAGCPIMVNRNDYGLGLFNGDVGILERGKDDGALHANFPESDGEVRSVSLARLPAHETAFAMTVHKSQGSEFDAVALVLPDADSPLLSRELLYTAITRARSFVSIHGSAAAIELAVGRRIERDSGLGDSLQDGAD